MAKMPTDLRKILSKDARTMNLWSALTPIAQRDFISWIESAKQSETRKRRVDSVPSRLTSGKKRPCCYAIVPMDLYRAIAGTPKAKAKWKDLTADEKRDFADWVGSASDKDTTRQRVERACRLIAAGTRRP